MLSSECQAEGSVCKHSAPAHAADAVPGNWEKHCMFFTREKIGQKSNVMLNCFQDASLKSISLSTGLPHNTVDFRFWYLRSVFSFTLSEYLFTLIPT